MRKGNNNIGVKQQSMVSFMPAAMKKEVLSARNDQFGRNPSQTINIQKSNVQNINLDDIPSQNVTHTHLNFKTVDDSNRFMPNKPVKALGSTSSITQGSDISLKITKPQEMKKESSTKVDEKLPKIKAASVVSDSFGDSVHSLNSRDMPAPPQLLKKESSIYERAALPAIERRKTILFNSPHEKVVLSREEKEIKDMTLKSLNKLGELMQQRRDSQTVPLTPQISQPMSPQMSQSIKQSPTNKHDQSKASLSVT